MMSAAFPSGRKRVVVFISGSGSNMVSLAKACQAADFPAEIVCVISDKASAGGLEKARSMGIPTLVFERKTYASKAEHEGAILAALGEIAPDIICLAGYMRLISGDFIAPYEGRIINIHPSLLPLFPGLNTHQRAIDSGMKISGCTVHFVTEGMDEGPTIAQGAVPVVSGDTAETLAARILTVEHQLYPLTLKRLAEGKVRMEDGKAVSTDDESNTEYSNLISAS
ncbi:phosphoribosylglycinamide formyltransferase [Agrobacterium sp. P15N1-A]|uniref:phosphoribosylglycinamide formyltransferase n=1 Tax=Agrobacterium sp. P15N1-A TaxID=3342820 RepID=UPI0037CD2220